MTNYMKSCSFLHAHFFEYMKVVETLFKKAYGEKLINFIEKTRVVGTHIHIEAILMCTYNIC